MITFCSDSVICCFAVLCVVALFLFFVIRMTQPGVVCVCATTYYVFKIFCWRHAGADSA